MLSAARPLLQADPEVSHLCPDLDPRQHQPAASVRDGRQPRPLSLASLALISPSEYGLRLRPPEYASGYSSGGLALEGHAHRVGSRGVLGQNLLQGDLVLPARTEVILVVDLDLAADGVT